MPVRARRPKAVAIMAEDFWRTQFGTPQRERLSRLADLTTPAWAPTLTDPALVGQLGDVEIMVTSWGIGPLTADLLDSMPRLHAIVHGAGSTRSFVTEALWERGVVVSTSADLNAEPVAEFTLAAIIMAGKKAPFLAADLRHDRASWSSRRPGRGQLSNAGLTIGIVGFSRIGRRVVALVDKTLHQPTCLVYDPYADPEDVVEAGAHLVSLEELLPRVDVLSLHAPALRSSRHMIGADELAALPDHSVVINTARGALIDQAALEAECITGRLHAILDVTDPEPPPADSPLYDLPNVMITPHIAGAIGTETRRMADGALDELERLVNGQPPHRRLHRDEFDISA